MIQKTSVGQVYVVLMLTVGLNSSSYYYYFFNKSILKSMFKKKRLKQLVTWLTFNIYQRA